jgi:hypothetical protein
MMETDKQVVVLLLLLVLLACAKATTVGVDGCGAFTFELPKCIPSEPTCDLLQPSSNNHTGGGGRRKRGSFLK